MLLVVIRRLLTGTGFPGEGNLRLLLPILGLSLIHVSAAQQVDRPAPPTTNSPRVSVVSKIAQSCGAGIAPPALQHSAERDLREAGFTISNLHTAELETGVDCVISTGRATRSELVVHQCLSFSEIVSSHANPGASLMAGTWRNCQSYRCSGDCADSAHQTQGALLRSFLDDFQNRQPQESQASRMLRQIGESSPARQTQLVMIYSLYILCCLSVLFHWQLRKSTTRLY